MTPVFFVCGTPSDKRGFEYAALGPGTLPGNPPAYLDRRLERREGVSYSIEVVSTGAVRMALYTQCYPINPNDSRINRGAFYAVGFVCAETPELHVASSCIARVGQLATTLSAELGPENAFPQGFRFGAFARGVETGGLVEQCSPLSRADLLVQAARRTGAFEHNDSLTFGDADYSCESTDGRLYSGIDTFAVQALDADRRRAAKLVETATHAAALAHEEQKKWLALRQDTHRELKGLAERGVHFEAVLEQLRREVAGAKGIAERNPNRARAVPDARIERNDTSRQPAAATGRENPMAPTWASRLGTSSTIITVIVVSITLVLAAWFLSNRPPVTVQAPARVVDTQQLSPAFEASVQLPEPDRTPDIVRERAALDGPQPADDSPSGDDN